MKLFILCVCAALTVEAQIAYDYKKVSDTYSLMNNTFNNNQLVGSVAFSSLGYCMATCCQQDACSFISIADNKCTFYNAKAITVPQSASSDLWFKRSQGRTMRVFNNSDTSLMNYWPILDGSPLDFKTGIELFSPSPTYAVDQYGSTGGAIKTTGSTTYWQAPPGVYFSGDFSITAWIKPTSCNQFSRFMDFGNDLGYDSIYVMISRQTTDCDPSVKFVTGNSNDNTNNHPQRFVFNQWNHFALTYCSQSMSVYINGVVHTVNQEHLYGPVRHTNYFGKSNWDDPYADAEFDEIKLYTRCLSGGDVVNDRLNVRSLIQNVTL